MRSGNSAAHEGPAVNEYDNDMAEMVRKTTLPHALGATG